MQKFFFHPDGSLVGSYDGPDASNPYPGLDFTNVPPADGRMIWTGSVWSYSPEALKDYTAAKRYAVETGGINVAGAPIKTDRESQGLITGAAALTKITGDNVKWKTEAGFVTVSALQIEAIAVSVGNHVQACFAAEAALISLIDAGTITTTEQIETWDGWP